MPRSNVLPIAPTRAPLLLVGLGGVGLMGLALARAMYGAAPFVADIDAKKREAALAAGAAEAFDPSDPNARKALLKASGGIYAACDFAGSGRIVEFCDWRAGQRRQSRRHRPDRRRLFDRGGHVSAQRR